ncbi:MAG: VWA domain-containing protein [Armatimonadetes bacterium]|nr:VWA domain-containing protein [Armatimonadota bacterium]CUU35091.1 Ca-activated chloride channel family protein [Armatimonadetes bacterium DC]
MDRTQQFNADPNRTQAMGASDPMRTQAFSMPVLDPNRTQAVPGLGAPAQPSLTMEVVLGRKYALAQTLAREGLLIQITASQTAAGRAPLNLCLVLDRSGSMEGAPFEYAKQACTYLVDQLTEQDVLSIVTFSDTVDVVMPPRKIVNKQLVKDHIMRLTVGDTTNLYDALVVGTQQLTSVNLPGYQAHLILLTDGEPTVGIKDFSMIVGVAARAKEFGFHMTALGFGPDYNEELLAGIARRSGGKYYYIDQPQRIPEVFQQELVRLMTVVARNPKLELQLARWVQVRQAFGGEYKLQGRTVEMQLVDAERGSTLTPVFELEFPNHPAGIYRIAKVKLTWEDIVTGRVETLTDDVVLEFTTDPAKANVPQDPRVANELQVALTSRALEKTIMGLRAHQLNQTQALQELQRTQALLLQQGRLQEAQQVTQAIRALQGQDTNTAEKTLMGTLVNLEQAKKEGGG